MERMHCHRAKTGRILVCWRSCAVDSVDLLSCFPCFCSLTACFHAAVPRFTKRSLGARSILHHRSLCHSVSTIFPRQTLKSWQLVRFSDRNSHYFGSTTESTVFLRPRSPSCGKSTPPICFIAWPGSKSWLSSRLRCEARPMRWCSVLFSVPKKVWSGLSS